MRRLSAIVTLVVLVGAMAIPAFGTGNGHERLPICHAGSEQNPNWVYIEPDANSYNGHLNHENDFFVTEDSPCPPIDEEPEVCPFNEALPINDPECKEVEVTVPTTPTTIPEDDDETTTPTTIVDTTPTTAAEETPTTVAESPPTTVGSEPSATTQPSTPSSSVVDETTTTTARTELPFTGIEDATWEMLGIGFALLALGALILRSMKNR